MTKWKKTEKQICQTDKNDSVIEGSYNNYIIFKFDQIAKLIIFLENALNAIII